MQLLLTTLATELERARAVSRQVVSHLGATYGVERGEVGVFLIGELPKLEDYELDLILSPLFTPTLDDQAVFAELLGRSSIPPGQWPALCRELAARPTRASLVTDDGQAHSVPLREVTVERYVNRLRLDGTMAEALFQLLSAHAPAADRPLLKAVARRAVWESEPRRQILTRYLSSAHAAAGSRRADAPGLLHLVETYQPADAGDLLGRLPHWRQVLRHEVNLALNPKPFLNERIQEMHGGGRDQRRNDDARVTAKERELALLDRLEQALAG